MLGENHIPQDGNNNGQLDKEEKDFGLKVSLDVAKAGFYAILGLAGAAQFAIPMIVSDLTGVPVTPSPQALSTNAARTAAVTAEESAADAEKNLLKYKISAEELQKARGGSKLPPYENPGHHDPSNSKNVFNKQKSVLPKNHEELFKESVLSSDGNRWTKTGTKTKPIYHRFQDDGNGKWHWNGSTDAKKFDGTPNPIKENNVPIEIKRIKI